MNHENSAVADHVRPLFADVDTTPLEPALNRLRSDLDPLAPLGSSIKMLADAAAPTVIAAAAKTLPHVGEVCKELTVMALSVAAIASACRRLFRPMSSRGEGDPQ